MSIEIEVELLDIIILLDIYEGEINPLSYIYPFLKEEQKQELRAEVKALIKEKHKEKERIREKIDSLYDKYRGFKELDTELLIIGDYSIIKEIKVYGYYTIIKKGETQSLQLLANPIFYPEVNLLVRPYENCKFKTRKDIPEEEIILKVESFLPGKEGEYLYFYRDTFSPEISTNLTLLSSNFL